MCKKAVGELFDFCCTCHTRLLLVRLVFKRLAVDNIEGAINFLLESVVPALKKEEELIKLNVE